MSTCSNNSRVLTNDGCRYCGTIFWYTTCYVVVFFSHETRFNSPLVIMLLSRNIHFHHVLVVVLVTERNLKTICNSFMICIASLLQGPFGYCKADYSFLILFCRLICLCLNEQKCLTNILFNEILHRNHGILLRGHFILVEVITLIIWSRRN